MVSRALPAGCLLGSRDDKSFLSTIALRAAIFSRGLALASFSISPMRRQIMAKSVPLVFCTSHFSFVPSSMTMSSVSVTAAMKTPISAKRQQACVMLAFRRANHLIKTLRLSLQSCNLREVVPGFSRCSEQIGQMDEYLHLEMPHLYHKPL